jgi:hypothetical protein
MNRDKIAKLGESAKRAKLPFPDCCRFWLEHQFGNLRVVVNSMLELSSFLIINVSLVSIKFTSVSGKKWCLRSYCTRKKGAQEGVN